MIGADAMDAHFVAIKVRKTDERMNEEWWRLLNIAGEKKRVNPVRRQRKDS